MKEWPDMINYGDTEFIHKKKLSDGVYKGHWLPSNTEVTVKHGLGKMKYKDNGAIYEGYWNHKYRHGMGKITYINKEFFYGLWIDDIKFSGIHFFKDGSHIYTGHWGSD